MITIIPKVYMPLYELAFDDTVWAFKNEYKIEQNIMHKA